MPTPRHLIACATLLAAVAQASSAATVTKSILKEYFQSGDKPTAQQFSTLIDSFVNYTDDRTLIGLRTYDPSKLYNPFAPIPVKRFGIGDTTPASPAEYIDPYRADLAPDFAGQSGFLALLLQDPAGQTYYGFLQLQMDPPSTDPDGTPLPPAINVQYLTYDDTPNTRLTAFLVPEPTSLLACGFAIPLLTRRRNR